jgi:hypothetical protein
MKALLFVFTMLLLVTASAADLTAINGTWSGNWTPKGGVPDTVTVELKVDESGKLTGKFRTPVPMDFSKGSFIPTTGTLMFEAMDGKSGTHYRLEGKFKGTEITGTFGANDTTGEVRLIKWTFFGP